MQSLAKALLAAFLITCSSGAAAAAASTGLPAQFPARILAAHNGIRAAAGVRPLAWDPALGAAAAAYAVQLALTGRFQHSSRTTRAGTGENLWTGTRGAYSYDAMVGAWASERRFFLPGIFPGVSRTGNWQDVGHYTQMIWPTTTRLGCAVAANARSDFLVCRYASAGNIDGRRVP